MLALFVCQCANGELKARRVLKDAKVKNYLSVRCYIGKKSIEIGMSSMPENIQKTVEWAAMKDLINQKTSYAIVAGWDANNLRWSDVYDGKIESVVPGEQIAEYFE